MSIKQWSLVFFGFFIGLLQAPWSEALAPTTRIPFVWQKMVQIQSQGKAEMVRAAGEIVADALKTQGLDTLGKDVAVITGRPLDADAMAHFGVFNDHAGMTMYGLAQYPMVAVLQTMVVKGQHPLLEIKKKLREAVKRHDVADVLQRRNVGSNDLRLQGTSFLSYDEDSLVVVEAGADTIVHVKLFFDYQALRKQDVSFKRQFADVSRKPELSGKVPRVNEGILEESLGGEREWQVGSLAKRYLKKPVRLGVNGAGRMGIHLFRLAFENPNFQVGAMALRVPGATSLAEESDEGENVPFPQTVLERQRLLDLLFADAIFGPIFSIMSNSVDYVSANGGHVLDLRGDAREDARSFSREALLEKLHLKGLFNEGDGAADGGGNQLFVIRSHDQRSVLYSIEFAREGHSFIVRRHFDYEQYRSRNQVVSVEDPAEVLRTSLIGRASSPEALIWGDVDVVLDGTGAFTTLDQMRGHLRDKRIRLAILTAPGKGAGWDDRTYVHGVNPETLNYVLAKKGSDRVISCASCTTNALAPVLDVVNGVFGVMGAHMVTVHAATNSQKILPSQDPNGKDYPLFGAASAATGAAKAVHQVGLTHDGRGLNIKGSAVRVPTPDGSVVHLTMVTDLPVKDKAELERVFEIASRGIYKGILILDRAVTKSTDVVEHKGSVVINPDLCEVELFEDSDGFVRSRITIPAFYSNERQYAKQLLRTVAQAAKLEFQANPAFAKVPARREDEDLSLLPARREDEDFSLLPARDVFVNEAGEQTEKRALFADADGVVVSSESLGLGDDVVIKLTPYLATIAANTQTNEDGSPAPTPVIFINQADYDWMTPVQRAAVAAFEYTQVRLKRGTAGYNAVDVEADSFLQFILDSDEAQLDVLRSIYAQKLEARELNWPRDPAHLRVAQAQFDRWTIILEMFDQLRAQREVLRGQGVRTLDVLETARALPAGLTQLFSRANMQALISA